MLIKARPQRSWHDHAKQFPNSRITDLVSPKGLPLLWVAIDTDAWRSWDGRVEQGRDCASCQGFVAEQCGRDAGVSKAETEFLPECAGLSKNPFRKKPRLSKRQKPLKAPKPGKSSLRSQRPVLSAPPASSPPSPARLRSKRA